MLIFIYQYDFLNVEKKHECKSSYLLLPSRESSTLPSTLILSDFRRRTTYRNLPSRYVTWHLIGDSDGNTGKNRGQRVKMMWVLRKSWPCRLWRWPMKIPLKWSSLPHLSWLTRLAHLEARGQSLGKRSLEEVKGMATRYELRDCWFFSIRFRLLDEMLRRSMHGAMYGKVSRGTIGNWWMIGIFSLSSNRNISYFFLSSVESSTIVNLINLKLKLK